VTAFTLVPRGPFSLAAARDFAGGFAAGIGARLHMAWRRDQPSPPSDRQG